MGSRGAHERDVRALQTEITATELREDLDEISRETLVEEFQADAGDEYNAKEEEFGPELMPSSSASSSSRSSTSAGASTSRTWRRCARASTSGRWRRRTRSSSTRSEGERIFAELGRAIRSEVVLHLFHAELAPEEAQQQLAQSADGDGNIHYEHETAAGADVIEAAGGGGGAVAAPDRARPVRQERARQDRPQRPVLVRQRQEVQEVPRRLIARECCTLARC